MNEMENSIFLMQLHDQRIEYFSDFFKTSRVLGSLGSRSGGGNAFSYERVALGINFLHEIKAKTINYIFFVSIKVHL